MLNAISLVLASERFGDKKIPHRHSYWAANRTSNYPHYKSQPQPVRLMEVRTYKSTVELVFSISYSCSLIDRVKMS